MVNFMNDNRFVVRNMKQQGNKTEAKQLYSYAIRVPFVRFHLQFRRENRRKSVLYSQYATIEMKLKLSLIREFFSFLKLYSREPKCLWEKMSRAISDKASTNFHLNILTVILIFEYVNSKKISTSNVDFLKMESFKKIIARMK